MDVPGAVAGLHGRPYLGEDEDDCLGRLDMGRFHISLFGGGKVQERHALGGVHWYIRLIGGYTLDLGRET